MSVNVNLKQRRQAARTKPYEKKTVRLPRQERVKPIYASEVLGREKKVPRRHWQDLQNHRSALLWAAKKLGLKTSEDYYHLRSHDLVALGLQTLMLRYGGSVCDLVIKCHPEGSQFEPWFFDTVPRGWFDKAQNILTVRRFIERDMGFVAIEDWYRLNTKDLQRMKLHKFLDHRYTFQEFVSVLVPESKGLLREWKFQSARVSHNFWSTSANVIAAVHDVAATLGIEEPSGWYKQTAQVFVEHLSSVLAKYGGSPIAVLRIAYPDYEWIPWYFREVPARYWEPKDNRLKAVLRSAEHVWHIDPEDQAAYYKLSLKDFIEARLMGMLGGHYHGHWMEALEDLFPDWHWDWTKCNGKGSYWERSAAVVLQELQRSGVIRDLVWTQQHRACKYGPDINTGQTRKMFFDLHFVVLVQLADGTVADAACFMEYDGDMHFRVRPDGRDTVMLLRDRNVQDRNKEAYCRENNCHLLRLAMPAGGTMMTIGEFKQHIVQFVKDVPAHAARHERLDRRLPEAVYRQRDGMVREAVDQHRPV